MSHLTSEFNYQAERDIEHEFILWMIFCLILDGESRRERAVHKKRQRELAAQIAANGCNPKLKPRAA